MFSNARARNSQVEATLNHPFPAQALIDEQLAAFLSRRGCSTADFLDVADADPLGAETLGEMVTAAASFETFVDLLVDAQEGRWAGAGCVTYA